MIAYQLKLLDILSRPDYVTWTNVPKNWDRLIIIITNNTIISPAWLQEPVGFDDEVTDCCCWCAEGPIIMKATLDKTGYAYGTEACEIFVWNNAVKCPYQKYESTTRISTYGFLCSKLIFSFFCVGLQCILTFY